MMKLGFTYLFLWAVNLGKMMKLGFTYLFLCAGKPKKNDGLYSLNHSCVRANVGKMTK
jgi:hypothetical protein